MKKLEDIIGQKCFLAETCYAEELKIELGEKIPYNHKKLEGFKGSWRIISRGEDWLLEKDDVVIAWDVNEVSNYKQLPILVDATIIDVKISYNNDVSFTFDNGCKLTICRNWGVLAPEHTYIFIGLSYRRSDEPHG